MSLDPNAIDPRVIVLQQPLGPAPVAPPTTSLTPEQAYELVERARKEEKDKLYPQIEEQATQLRVLTQEREERLAGEEAAQQEAAEARRREEESRMSVEDLLNKNNQTWEERFAQMNQEREADRALLEKERQFNFLSNYTTRRLQEEEQTIAPQLRQYVSGNNEAEIEASIQRAQATTSQIMAEIAAASPIPPEPRRVGLPPSGMPPVDMPGGGGAGLGSEQEVVLTPEDIRGMTMEEYAQYRPQMLSAASARVRGGGLYQP